MWRLYSVETKAGEISIVTDGPRYLPELRAELFGSYEPVPELIEDLVIGGSLLSLRRIETEKLKIPDNVPGGGNRLTATRRLVGYRYCLTGTLC